ncbi:MAG: anthranilate synthase component I family protein [Deltaproteobacteria bacterium]|nr:anthranilate synthase component I family protein [Deltaproteobacteria bacterium]
MNLFNIFPKITSFRNIPLHRFTNPEIIFSHLYQKTYSVLLCGRGNPDNSRFAYIGIHPFLRIHYKKNEATINLDNGEVILSVDPFQLLRAALKFYTMKLHPFPISLWGGIGYFSYDAAHCIEKLPKTTIDDLNMPIMEMIYYKDFLIFDYQKEKSYLVQAETEKGFNNPQEIMELFGKGWGPASQFSVESPKSCCTREGYITLVKKIIDYIKKGDVYEVNLSHRFEAKYQGDPYGIFLNLFRINPAPFSAYLNAGDNNIIISNSPERFLRAEGDWVETRPIKGTIGRRENRDEDQKNRLLLANSEKDDAELSMIVDLLRNDLGKVCEYGSVRVQEHKRIEGFSNVWHLISIVEGKLRTEEDYSSLIRACFPGGSITGCPKIRSMEIIDELEMYGRNIYTGMIFIISDNRLDSSIVIRTIIAKKGTLYFSVGGAVVYDSLPNREYEEALEKAQSIMKAIKKSF